MMVWERLHARVSLLSSPCRKVRCWLPCFFGKKKYMGCRLQRQNVDFFFGNSMEAIASLSWGLFLFTVLGLGDWDMGSFERSLGLTNRTRAVTFCCQCHGGPARVTAPLRILASSPSEQFKKPD